MKLYFILTALIISVFYISFNIAMTEVFKYLVVVLKADLPLGPEAFGLAIVAGASAIAISTLVVLVFLIVFHKLSKRFFPGAAFWRTSLLALLSTFLLLFLWLLFWPQ